MSPVVAMPSMNCFCAMKYRINTGSMLMLAPAIQRCVSGPASVTKFCKPTETGHQPDPARVAIKGHSSEFQWRRLQRLLDE